MRASRLDELRSFAWVRRGSIRDHPYLLPCSPCVAQENERRKLFSSSFDGHSLYLQRGRDNRLRPRCPVNIAEGWGRGSHCASNGSRLMSFGYKRYLGCIE